jgi:hypothetical protein
MTKKCDLDAHARAAGFADFDEYERARDRAIDWLIRGVPLPDVINTTRLPEAEARFFQQLVEENPQPVRSWDA